MKVFEGVDIEMFDPLDEIPNNGEYVLIVLKQEYQPFQKTVYNRIYFKGNLPFSRLRIVKTTVYKNKRVKFFDHTGIQHESHTLNDIICWGRFKP